jgi:hypothetical protein
MERGQDRRPGVAAVAVLTVFVVIGDSWWQLIIAALLGGALAEFGFLVSFRNRLLGTCSGVRTPLTNCGSWSSRCCPPWVGVELSDQLGTAAGQ